MTFASSRLAFISVMLALIIPLSLVSGCRSNSTVSHLTVPHEGKWGIYELDLSTQRVSLIYSTSNEIYTSALRLDSSGSKLAFAQKIDGLDDSNLEIYSIGIDGSNPTRLTNDPFMDVYPAWSPDGTRIAFLSKREKDLDIYVMDADGSNITKLYDSGFNDGDVDWVDGSVVFTSRFTIWKMNADGTQPVQITHPPNRGQWGSANLPAGDYDPRMSPDGRKIAFERLEDTSQPNGGYDIFVVNSDGTGETRLTQNDFSQGLPSWAHSGDKLVYTVAAMNGQGKYDLFMMNADGTDNRNITPDYFPVAFLCYTAIFSSNDSQLYFIGQWSG